MRQNQRRLFALLLAILLTWTLAAPALAAESGDIHLRTAQDLVTFSQNCALDSWSVGKTVYLDADIDLTGSQFQPIPIFNGTFYGQGHTISGFTLTGSGDDRGFFRYVQSTAILRDLTVTGSVAPSDRKDSIGGLVGVNSGKLLNCSFQGSVKGGTNVGGVAGCNKPTGQLINCTYSGTLLGEHYVGGIVGLNEGSVIRCRNDGRINITEVKTTVALHEVSLSTIRSTENAPASTDIGGIAGASSGLLQSCTNNGDVGYEHVGYNVGGIAGRQSGWLDSCENSGTVRGRKDVGGICGQMEPRLTLLFDPDSLDDLWDELDTLQALMDKAISDGERVSDDISSRITGITDSVDEAKDAASGLSHALTGWTDENIETINDVSARISWTMDRLEPISDSVGAALDRVQESADLAGEALDELDQAGGLAEDALDDLRLALEQVRDSAKLASRAVDRLQDAMNHLRDGLGDGGAVSGAMDEVRDGLDDLVASFGALSDAFDSLWAAVGNLHGQSAGGAVDSARENPEESLAGKEISAEGGMDWTEVLEALDELGGAADQIQSAFRALNSALKGVGTTTEGVIHQSLTEAASAAEALGDSFALLDKAAAHMEDAMDDLGDGAPYGENASALLKEAAETLGDACGQLREAGDTFRSVMSELADRPEISFSPVGEAVDAKGDALDSAMGGLSDAMESLNDTVSASSDLLLEDIRAINNQFGRVIDVLRRHTDSEKEEDGRELLEDISDQATETDEDAGRIINARNLGAVEGDVNVAGIVGSMAIEYDYDPEDDLTTSGDRSLNFRYQAAALTENCVNSGEVTGKKDYVGGIVGRMDLGTVSQCESYAPVESTSGDYVGGIAGAAWSTIRGCWARCVLSGNDYVGGVAGLGKTVRDCRSLVEISQGEAYLGAVLGGVEEGGDVSGNRFTYETVHGINGVSYQGQAEPVDFAALSQDAPSAFTQFRLVFMADGQVVDTFDFTYGDALAQLPDIPAKKGYRASWPDIDYGCLTFSRTLEAEYTACSTALTAMGDPPRIVVEGTFSSDTTMSASSNEAAWTDDRGTAHTGQVYTVEVADPTQPVAAFQVQYKLSEGASDGTVWVKTAQGWEQRDAELDGTYLVFQAEGDSVTFAVQERAVNPVVLAVSVSGAAAAAGILALLWRKWRKRPSGEENAG